MEKQAVEAEAGAPKGRLLARLAALLVRNAGIVSGICCIAGLLCLILLPALSKPVYVDENALLPGSARATFTNTNAHSGLQLAKELKSLFSSSSNDSQRVFREWFSSHMHAIGADHYFQTFCPPDGSFSVSSFLTSSRTYSKLSDGRCHLGELPGLNAVGILRAPQGEGNEAIVLVSSFELSNITPEDATTLGMSLALLQLLSSSLWLAKDVIWLAADRRFGEYTPVAAWLKEYHEPSMSLGDSDRGNIFQRAGSIAAAFVVELTPSPEKKLKRDLLEVRVEGSNGQMPNMDMISIVQLLVSWRQNFDMTLERVRRIEEWPLTGTLGSFLGAVSEQAAVFRRTFLSHSKAVSISGDEYVSGISTLARSCWLQMIGIPTGSHGAFRDFQVDAVTLKVSSSRAEMPELMLDLGRLVEGVLRSVNNLLEKFHQSLFLYIMVSPDKFVSISTYIIPFALLLVNFPIQAASLFSSCKPGLHSSWIQAVVFLVAVEASSLVTAVVPVFLPQLPESIPLKLLVWSLSSLVIFSAAPSLSSIKPSTDEWFIPLKALTLGLTGIALGVLSAVNFSVALGAALFLLPMCLTAQPLSISWSSLLRPDSSFASRFRAVLAPLLTCFPVVAAGVVMFYSQTLAGVWSWVELMWFWGSALYISVFLIQLPCSIICLYITFAR